MKIINLSPEHVGKKVTCNIGRHEITDAVMQYEKGKYYICQNKSDGTRCDNRLGYKYSWVVNDGRESEIERLGVKELFLEGESYEIY